jgi:hypothetical protein
MDFSGVFVDFSYSFRDFSWTFQVLFMGFQWTFHGLLLTYYGDFMKFVWIFYWPFPDGYDGIFMDFSWTFRGVFMHFWWSFRTLDAIFPHPPALYAPPFPAFPLPVLPPALSPPPPPPILLIWFLWWAAALRYSWLALGDEAKSWSYEDRTVVLRTCVVEAMCIQDKIRQDKTWYDKIP